ncbi:MAG: photosystem II stability/assembly factor-like uncharacterized protein/uncharacterized protein YukE [Saprospiraceae bacterium]|jgi:photosystem II stability/assembly factor-like uncharacterized protein/uncharacterized protein YukE
MLISTFDKNCTDMINRMLPLLALSIFMLSCASYAQVNKESEEPKSPLEELSLSGLKFRNIGPAITSGRISDIALSGIDDMTYYVATSSGGVWKTVNWGTTFTPVFDNEGSYSIGCVTVDPNNPSVIWVGTGENNNQRSVAYGDGIYKSVDGGASWKHMGLKQSEHIGNIIVHPKNSEIIYVAAIGPLWSEGGDRGLYKSTDGGENWNAVLTIDEHTGVNEVHMDPRDPNVLYVSTFQRRRHVFTYLGGGPGSGIQKSVDGGATWQEINKGLPKVDIGRIGMDISPADPEIIYAIVEAAQGKGGMYRSTDRGASWHKQGDYSTSGNYYQEIIAHPTDANTVYAMDTWMKVSTNGGKTFSNVGEDTKHVDNHSLWVNPVNSIHWLVGCDGGIYETFDAAKTWIFKANLPVTQFYKVAVDNDVPFYNVYGGTQDNFSLGGPSRVITDHGIQNSDWFITHGGDGFESQVDPENPDIVYAQSQHGVLVRYDRKSGEEVGIQPKERKGENSYRWNWDAPLAVSHHGSGRLYFAANKLFRSDDRGNSWEVLSDDLTAQINRNELDVMGRIWGIDAVAKNKSTSLYGTIVAFSESPIDENLLVVGTDDGLIQITNDGGQNWSRIENIVGVPKRTYVNAVYTSQHNADVIYAAFNHHKYGDFKPYIYKSADRGKTWSSISATIPERGSVYSIEEDHVDPNLIFCGTEFGVFFSPNKGDNWKQLKAGMPTIAVRDIAIQRRENDLVLGTFGRGFYVLDDYTSLRNVKGEGLGDTPQLFVSRDALMFEKSMPLGLPGKSFQGDDYYTAENLGPVAMITYYLPESQKSKKEIRQEKEKENKKNKSDNSYPSYEELTAEVNESKAQILFSISDASGSVIRKILNKPGKGVQRFLWDLRYAPKNAISLKKPAFYNPFAGKKEGSLVAPGRYSVSMSLVEDGEIKPLGAPVSFEVKALGNTVLPAQDRESKVAFQREVTELSRAVEGAEHMIGEIENKLKHIHKAIELTEQPMSALYADYNSIQSKIKEIKKQMSGDKVKSQLDIDQPPTPATRLGWIEYEQKNSTSEPTATHRASFAIAKEEFVPILNTIKTLATNDLEALEQKLEDADAPYTPGRAIKMLNRN